MSEGAGPADKIAKFPISNYDIVVYFGVGISFLPFATRYFLAANGNVMPVIFFGYSDPLVNNIVSLVCLAFVVYIIGHGISILASMFVEQFVYKFAGPPSQIIINAITPNTDGDNSFRSDLKSRVYDSLSNISPTDLFRLCFHMPVIPLYLLMYILRIHGFYETKLTSFVVLRIQDRLERCFDFSGTIMSNTKWFKIVEYACANDHPVATSKMYNYMVIYGLFRSVAFLILSALWFEIYFFFSMGGVGFIDQTGHGNIFLRLFVLYSMYLISLSVLENLLADIRRKRFKLSRCLGLFR